MAQNPAAFTALLHRITTNTLQAGDLDEQGVLRLKRQELDDTDAQALAEALITNTTVTCLYLYNNQIGDEGAKALAEALHENKTLTDLYLGFNLIGNEGAEALAKMLETNTTLTTLNLEGNNIEDTTLLRRIESYLARNRKFAQQEAKIAELQTELQNIRTMVMEFKAMAEGLKTELRDTKMEIIATKLALKETKGEYDTEKEKLVLDLQRLMEEQISAFEAELKQLATATVSQEDWKRVDTKLREVLQDDPEVEAHTKEMLEKMQKMVELTTAHARSLEELTEFTATHGNTLAKISREREAQDIEKQNLAKALNTPQARFYYHTLVSEMNSLYMAASIATTGYVPIQNKSKKFKTVSNLLKGLGKLVPSFGGYFETAGQALDAIGLRYTKKHLAAFAGIADNAQEMDAIIQKVAYKLVTDNCENLTHSLAKTHIQKMIQAVFNGKLKSIKGIEEVSVALVNAAEDNNDLHAKQKAVQTSRKPSVMGHVEKLGDVDLARFYKSDLMTHSSGEDKHLKGEIERFIERSRDIIFDTDLSPRYRAKIQGSLNRTLYKLASNNPAFRKALLNPNKEDEIWDTLAKGIPQKFEDKDISKMKVEEIDAITFNLSMELAGVIAPQQQAEQNIKLS